MPSQVSFQEGGWGTLDTEQEMVKWPQRQMGVIWLRARGAGGHWKPGVQVATGSREKQGQFAEGTNPTSTLIWAPEDSNQRLLSFRRVWGHLAQQTRGLAA